MIKDLQDEITKVNARIEALNYYNTKLDGEYLDGITQTGGLISVTKKGFDTSLTDTSVIAPQSKVVKAYVDAETSRAETVEDSLGNDIASLNDDLSDTNTRLNNEILRANMSEAQIQAKLDIETNARVDADNELQSNIDDVNTRIDNLDYSSTASADKTITSITQADGKVNVVYNSIAITQSQITDAATGSEVDAMLEEVFK